MRTNRMPTTIVLLIFSWWIAVLGLLGGGYLMVFKFREGLSFLNGFLILVASLLLAAVVRMLSIIGQIVFDLLQAVKNHMEQINCDTKDINQNIHQIKIFFEQIERHLDLKK